ncbi:ABC transporter substrate-binding protein [Actinophytocola sp.]|uniref:ABC transporter substrate-binding protein n=1 Tax=Actinophytocola sp. TaxID=1872138 RepID=UPI003D6A30FE
MLVEDYEVDAGGLVYTFTLRDGVTFHNGQDLSSADVVASLEAFGDLTPRGKRLFSFVKSLTAPDKRTVELTLTSPSGLLLNILADRGAGVLPASIVEAAGDTPLEPDQIIGTGPYKLEGWEPNVAITLARFDDYKPAPATFEGQGGEKIAYFDEIKIVPVPDAAARVAGLESGQFDWAEILPVDLYDRFKSDPRFKVSTVLAGMFTILFNSKDAPSSDPVFRRAILTGLDFESLGATQGPPDLWNSDPGMLASTEGLHSKDNTDPWGATDVNAAKNLIEQSDYNGEELQLVTTSASPQTYNIALDLSNQLQAMGIKVKLENVELSALQERRPQAKGWHIITARDRVVPTPDLYPWIACGNTYGGYCSQEMDGLLEQLFTAADEGEIQQTLDEIQSLYFKDVPNIKVVESLDVNGYSVDVQGYHEGASFPFFYNVWKRR